MRQAYDDIKPFVTKDGSVIRELMHARHQSLAEATVPPGVATVLHRHHKSEELYSITKGRGRMRLGAQEMDVRAGDTIAIPPGTPHRIRNDGHEDLVLLCCCAPPYSDEDTELLE